jgi:hypothetical protein
VQPDRKNCRGSIMLIGSDQYRIIEFNGWEEVVTP